MKRLLILASMACLFSCDPNRVYEENTAIDGDFWYVDSLMTFQFEIPEPASNYNLYANFTHSSAYEFHNLYYRYRLQEVDGKELKTDLVNLNLFDPKTGQPLGSGLGDVFDHQQPILESYNLTPGEYQVSFQQYMRTDSLPEIRAVGLRVEQVSPDSGE